MRYSIYRKLTPKGRYPTLFNWVMNKMKVGHTIDSRWHRHDYQCQCHIQHILFPSIFCYDKFPQGWHSSLLNDHLCFLNSNGFIWEAHVVIAPIRNASIDKINSMFYVMGIDDESDEDEAISFTNSRTIKWSVELSIVQVEILDSLYQSV
jgi:hypothetical protein